MKQINDVGPRLRFFLFGVACCLVAFGGGKLLSSRRSHLVVHAKEPEQIDGPWGTIEAIPLPLVNPDGVVPDQENRIQLPRWYFADRSEDEVTQLFRTCRLRPVQWSILTDKQFWTTTSNACIIRPPEPIIWSLSPRARRLIYSTLAHWPENYAQCYPFRFEPSTFGSQLKDCGLTDTDIAKVRRLAYTNAGAVCFTDLETLHKVLGPSHFEEFVGALYTVPAYSLHLKVNRDSDANALARYWGAGNREKLVYPLIKASTQNPNGNTINIAEFLPGFARSRLYTYPDAWNDPNAPREDCFFAALNFFNETVDTNYFDRDIIAQALRDEFVPVEGSPHFGDRLLLVDGNSFPIHICVYIAADFVYTKNGINRAEPWVLMRLSDVLTTYAIPQRGGRTIVYRQKQQSLAAAVEELAAE